MDSGAEALEVAQALYTVNDDEAIFVDAIRKKLRDIWMRMGAMRWLQRELELCSD